MSNIRNAAVATTKVVHLKDSADELMYGEDKQPQTVTIYGPGSKEFAAAKTAQNNRMLDLLKRKGKANQTPEQAAAEKVAFLCDITKEFSANVEYVPDGATESLKGAELAKAIYGDLTIGFIADQVGSEIGEWGSFTKAVTKS